MKSGRCFTTLPLSFTVASAFLKMLTAQPVKNRLANRRLVVSARAHGTTSEKIALQTVDSWFLQTNNVTNCFTT